MTFGKRERGKHAIMNCSTRKRANEGNKHKYKKIIIITLKILLGLQIHSGRNGSRQVRCM
jgi:hypothetical protein